MTETKELSHSEAQAKSQLESIVTMVRALDRKTAAEDFVSALSDDRVKEAFTKLDGVNCSSVDEMREVVSDLIQKRNYADEVGFEFDEDAARTAIMDDALSLEVRSGWCASKEDMEPEEFRILLCTGGPAVRIRGDLDRGEPSRAWIEHQDWGTPWTEFHGDIEQDTLLAYCRQFYFGE